MLFVIIVQAGVVQLLHAMILAIVVWQDFFVVGVRNSIILKFETFKRSPLVNTDIVVLFKRVMIVTTFVLRIPALLLSIAIEVILVSKAILLFAIVASIAVQLRLVSVVVQVEELVIERVPIVIES